MLLWLRLFSLISFCVFSEYSIVNVPPGNYFVNALLDSLIHSITGALCWFVIYQKPLLEVLACGLLSSLIDVDHFLAAKSFSVKAALSLPYRPIFHAVVAIPVIALLAGLTSRLFINLCGNFWLLKPDSVLRQILLDSPYLIVVAWCSHQLRDSLRRGLWFWPIGSSPKTPFVLYIFLVSGVPCFIHYVLHYYHSQSGITPSDSLPKLPIGAENLLEV